MQVFAFPLKKRMGLYVQHDVKISCRAAVGANVTLFLVAYPGAIFHARRYAHINHVLFHHAAFSLALRTRIGNYPSQALASWTRPGDAEHCLLITHLAAACARWARARTFRSR